MGKIYWYQTKTNLQHNVINVSKYLLLIKIEIDIELYLNSINL